MTRRQHLLIKLIEECAEVQKEATKILTFGLVEEDGEQHKSLRGRDIPPNGPRLEQEIIDVIAVIDMLEEEMDFPRLSDEEKCTIGIQAKKSKVEAYMKYAHSLGQLEIK